MNKKLYQLLKLDVSKLPESEPISNQEVNNIMKRFREENGTQPIKRRRKPKMSAVIIAALVAACGGTTVFAATNRNLFRNLEDNKTKTHVTDDGREFQVDKTPDLNNYEMLENFAETEVEPEIAESDELSVSIESTYCDGRTLVLGLTGSLNGGNPNGYRYIGLNSITIDCGDVVFATEDRLDDGITNYKWLEGNMMLDEGTENSFSGQITLKLDEENMLTESKSAVITLGKLLIGDDYFNIQNELNDIELKKRIVVDKDLINGNAVEQSEDGYKVRLSNYSPAEIRVDWEFPKNIADNTITEIENRVAVPTYSMVLFFCDENDNEIPFLNDGYVPVPNKSGGSLTTPTGNIVVARIMNKQEHTDDEVNHYMKVYKEFTFDISELRDTE